MRPPSFLNVLAPKRSGAGSEVVPSDTFSSGPRSKSAKIEAASDRFVDLFKRIAAKESEEKN